jgi:adenosine deaminase
VDRCTEAAAFVIELETGTALLTEMHRDGVEILARGFRIGHGTRAEEDPRLLDYLAEHRIPLEMCPLSNVRTAVVDSISRHPNSQIL